MALTVNPGESITLYATFMNKRSQLVDQPDPALRIERVNPQNGQHEVILANTSLSEIEPGRYYYVWHVGENIPLGTVVARYFGAVDGIPVVGEDIVQVMERVQQRIVTNTAGVA